MQGLWVLIKKKNATIESISKSNKFVRSIKIKIESVKKIQRIKNVHKYYIWDKWNWIKKKSQWIDTIDNVKLTE